MEWIQTFVGGRTRGGAQYQPAASDESSEDPIDFQMAMAPPAHTSTPYAPHDHDSPPRDMELTGPLPSPSPRRPTRPAPPIPSRPPVGNAAGAMPTPGTPAGNAPAQSPSAATSMRQPSGTVPGGNATSTAPPANAITSGRQGGADNSAHSTATSNGTVRVAARDSQQHAQARQRQAMDVWSSIPPDLQQMIMRQSNTATHQLPASTAVAATQPQQSAGQLPSSQTRQAQATPAAPRQLSQPAGPPQRSHPVGAPQLTQPAVPLQQSQPAVPPQLSQPAASHQLTQPTMPHQQSQPAAPPQLSQPVAQPRLTQPQGPPTSVYNYPPPVSQPLVAAQPTYGVHRPVTQPQLWSQQTTIPQSGQFSQLPQTLQQPLAQSTGVHPPPGATYPLAPAPLAGTVSPLSASFGAQNRQITPLVVQPNFDKLGIFSDEPLENWEGFIERWEIDMLPFGLTETLLAYYLPKQFRGSAYRKYIEFARTGHPAIHHYPSLKWELNRMFSRYTPMTGRSLFTMTQGRRSVGVFYDELVTAGMSAYAGMPAEYKIS